MKEVIILTGAGQIGMAVARRIGYGKKIIIGDKNIENAQNICNTKNMAGYDATPFRDESCLKNLNTSTYKRGSKLRQGFHVDKCRRSFAKSGFC